MTALGLLEAGEYIDVNGVRTHYHDAGDGPVVLFIHGSGPGVSAWANWRHNLPVLSKGARVVALDLVGYGFTTRPDDVYYSLRTWTDHAWGFMDALGVQRFSVVGNSLGGRIALQMSEDAPDRLERMVLMGAPGVGMTMTEGLKALRSYEPSIPAMRELLVKYFAVDPSIITDELVNARYQASALPGAHEAYTAMFSDPRHAGSRLEITEEQSRAIKTETLVLHGREDSVVPPSVAWSMSRLIPRADLQVFAGCGHWTQIERANDFNRVVANFLGIGVPAA